jgi:zona occludens toxin
MRVYEKRYFGLYKSHTQGQSVGEEGASDTRPIWMAWPILAAVACFVVVGGFAATGGFSGMVTPKISAPAAPSAKHSPAWLDQASLTPEQRADIARASASPSQSLPVAHPAPEPEPVAQEPYAALGVHLTGSLTRKDGSTLYAFSFSRQGSYLYAGTSDDLRAAGYSFRALAHCVGELSWGKVRRIVICDTPQVSLAVGPAPGSGVRSFTVDPVALAREGVEHAREGTPLAGSGAGARSAP